MRSDVGSFRLLYEIKRGGLGSIFRAFDRQSSRTAIVKIIEVPEGLVSWEIEAFRETLQTLQTLNHPHCARVLAADLGDGFGYVAREELPHIPFDPAFAPNGVLALDAALDFVLQAAHGLQAAARIGLNHGHLHPEKLRLDANQRIRVTGFGEAIFASRILAATGMEPRTLAFLAPESLRGYPEDERTDIYALGAILYHLLTGVTPGEGETDLSRLRDLLERGLPRIETFIPDLPPAVAGLINRMIHPDQTLRFQMWEEVIARLETARAALSQRLAIATLRDESIRARDAFGATSAPLATPPVARPKVSTSLLKRAPSFQAAPSETPAPRPGPPARNSATQRLVELAKADTKPIFVRAAAKARPSAQS